MVYDVTATKEALIAHLDWSLQAVDTYPLTRHQKLRLYKAGICSRLSWLLLIEELPMTQERDANHSHLLSKEVGRFG